MTQCYLSYWDRGAVEMETNADATISDYMKMVVFFIRRGWHRGKISKPQVCGSMRT